MTHTHARSALLLGAASLAFTLHAAQAQQADKHPADPRGPNATSAKPEYGPTRYTDSAKGFKGLVVRTLGDAKAYYTAPLRWNARDWEFFGGALGAIAAAHHYDAQVRTHFDQGSSLPFGPQPSSTSDLTDALPGFAAFAATWGYATLVDSRAGKSEAWNMLESAGLASMTGFAMKYVFGRQRPDATTDPNRWFSGGSSFPSLHVTAAFAIGTVMAESGNPQVRWIRRVIGYGIGAGTAYLRMKHNAHWLSDTVAAAALGMATAHFVMHRSAERHEGNSAVSVVPVRGGIMLAYTADFN